MEDTDFIIINCEKWTNISDKTLFSMYVLTKIKTDWMQNYVRLYKGSIKTKTVWKSVLKFEPGHTIKDRKAFKIATKWSGV